MDEPARPTVRVSDPGEIAASLPALLGFRPHESVVLIALGGSEGSRVGLVVRADLPAGRSAGPLAGELAQRVATDDPAGVLVAVVSEAPDDREPVPGAPGETLVGLPHRGVVHDLVLALTAVGVPARDALLVRAGRWWSYDCPYPCCAPDAGTALPEGIPAATVAAVAGGSVVEPDRAALEARIARAGDGATTSAVWWSGRRRGGRVVPAGAAEASRAWTAIVRALPGCRPGSPAPPGDRALAEVVWALTDPDVRDRALGLVLGEDAAAAETLWLECTRRAPAPLDAAPATLLAVSAWLRGDGAMANVALARALASRPGYRLAELLVRALAVCLPPTGLRALIQDLVGDTGGGQAAG